MIKLKDLLKEELTDADIKVGDAYHVKSHIGYMVNFVYEKEYRGGATMIEYQFKPQYGAQGFMSVGTSILQESRAIFTAGGVTSSSSSASLFWDSRPSLLGAS